MKTAKNPRKALKYILPIAAVAILVIAAVIITFSLHNRSDEYECYVMGPLEKVEDFDAFEKQLETLKSNGVYGITTDVWWGYVEPTEGTFDWSYYKTYADTVRKAGLKWVPIMSTHACGGNVGDSVNVPIPSWVWQKDSVSRMAYKDENGNYDDECISPWWPGTADLYKALYSSFAENFKDYSDIIARIEISTGPSGELRYPSYNASAGWIYPERGYLECYSDAAVTSFRNAMKEKYGTVSALNDAWETSLSDFSEVAPPSDCDDFFKNRCDTAYGKDFLTWYQGSLTSFLGKIAKVAHSSFDPVFGVDIGAKVSGVHWLYNSPTMPHAAERCAGYYDYGTLLDAFKASKVDFTFTCLEMDDSGTSPNYSMPQTLAEEVSALAANKGVKHFGENALAISNNPRAYKNCANILRKYNYSGFTLLRLSNVVKGDGTETAEMSTFKDVLVNLSESQTSSETSAKEGFIISTFVATNLAEQGAFKVPALTYRPIL